MLHIEKGMVYPNFGDSRVRSDPKLTAKGLMTLGEGFLRTCEAYPDAQALNIGDDWLSYGELYTTACQWAATLQAAAKGRPLRRIGIFGHRSECVYIGIVTSILLGATYVPLNTSFPMARSSAMAKAAKLDAIIADSNALQQLMHMDASALPPLILAPRSHHQEFTQGKIKFLSRHDVLDGRTFKLRVASLDSEAYILFTSGSTGKPKGVPISHRNVAHFLKHNLNRYRLDTTDRLSQTFDHTFDLSVFDIFMAWWSGACVCVMTKLDSLAPGQFIESKAITIWFSVPSTVRLMQQGRQITRGGFPGLRLSLFCGEALGRSQVEAWAEAAPNSVIENIYGPTELTIACSAYRWNKRSNDPQYFNDLVPIGRLYPDMNSLIVDEHDHCVQQGAIGELCVDGPQRFQGYINAPELNTTAFLQDAGGKTYYRTGDLVFINEDGDLVYVGRKDQQVKIGGFRVELGEIEGELRRMPGVIEAAVVLSKVVDQDSERQELTAYVMGHHLTKSLVHAALKDFLPPYMLPQRIVNVLSFPLNGNGKIDRRLLAEGNLQGKS